MTEFAQRFRFDLPDTFARHCEMLTDFFERVFRTRRPESKPHLDHFLFARRQRSEHFIRDLTQV